MPGVCETRVRSRSPDRRCQSSVCISTVQCRRHNDFKTHIQCNQVVTEGLTPTRYLLLSACAAAAPSSSTPC